MTRPLRIVAISDTDSYVKWSAALLGAAGAAIDPTLLILRTPRTVSAAQETAALTGSGLAGAQVRRVDFVSLVGVLNQARPDVVLLASTGPLVRVLARLVGELTPRPVIVSGLPGISFPATSKGIVLREQCDFFILHSVREVDDFTALAARRGTPQNFGLARLPFASRRMTPVAGTDLVFAAQAIVPRERADREHLARLLVDAARADPTRRVVVKIRGGAGEHQTHPEDLPLPDLIAALGVPPQNLVVSAEPMGRALDTAEGLVTVSSTAALEAIARGIPVVILDAYGVSESMINTVFIGSGLVAGPDAVRTRNYRQPRPSWMHDNYFHPPEDDDWLTRVEELVALRRSGRLAPKEPRPRPGGRLRFAWERKHVLGRLDRSWSGRMAGVIGTPIRRAQLLLRDLRRLVSPPASAPPRGAATRTRRSDQEDRQHARVVGVHEHEEDDGVEEQMHRHHVRQ